MLEAKVVLEDGSIFKGEIFGANTESSGEIVFNTSMTGYQEILTDPSYKGEIVCMTYPLIGNYGINADDFESQSPHVNGLIVREFSQDPENWRYKKKLNEYLIENNITAISGIDTRALTKRLREKGTVKGIITSERVDEKVLINKAEKTSAISGRDLISQVSRKETEVFGDNKKNRVVLIDCGAKKNIIDSLVERGVQVIAVPASTKADEILSYKADGIMISNGPGDPKDASYVVETIKNLLGKKAIFGICLGHQLLALACGADTYKLKFGHRGANHPVKDLKSNRVYITSQNHGFAISEKSIEGLDLEVTHINVNDNTIEGIRHKKHAAFSVQYHPEASPGPEDSHYLFEQFLEMIN